MKLDYQSILQTVENISEVKLMFREDITDYIFTEILETTHPLHYFIFEYNNLLYFAIVKYNKKTGAPKFIYFSYGELSVDEEHDDYSFFIPYRDKIEEKFGIRFADTDCNHICICGNDSFKTRYENNFIFHHIFTCSKCNHEIIDDYDFTDEDEIDKYSEYETVGTFTTFYDYKNDINLLINESLD